MTIVYEKPANIEPKTVIFDSLKAYYEWHDENADKITMAEPVRDVDGNGYFGRVSFSYFEPKLKVKEIIEDEALFSSIFDD